MKPESEGDLLLVFPRPISDEKHDQLVQYVKSLIPGCDVVPFNRKTMAQNETVSALSRIEYKLDAVISALEDEDDEPQETLDGKPVPKATTGQTL